MRMLDEGANDNDVSVSFADQQSINAFSRYNARVTEAEGELKQKRGEKEAAEEAALELELVDEDEEVLYKLGDVFLSIPQPRAIEYLERDTARLNKEIEVLQAAVEECEEEMKKLKVVLYGKFGKNINLERE